MKELAFNFLKNNNKRTIRKILFFSIFSFSLFMFLELFYKKDYSCPINILYNHRSFSLIFLAISIFLIMFQIYFFDKTKVENTFLTSFYGITSFSKDKNKLLFSIELIYSSIGYIIGITLSTISFIVLELIEKMKYGIEFRILVYPYFVVLAVVLLTSSLYLIKKRYKEIKEEKNKDDYSFFTFGVIFLVFLYFFIDFNDYIYLLFFIVLNIVSITFIYKLIVFMIKAFSTDKINSFFLISFVEKRDIKKYLVMFIFLFMIISLSNEYINNYKNNRGYSKYDYIIETDDINKSLENIMLNEDYIYSLETLETVGYYKNNLLLVKNIELSKSPIFYNYEFESKMEEYVENSIILPSKFKNIYNKKLGDSFLIDFGTYTKTYTIYGFINNDNLLYCFADINENATKGNILIKTIDNDENNNFDNVYGDIKTINVKEEKMMTSYNIRLLIFYLVMILSLVVVIIIMIIERKKYLSIHKNKMIKFENSHIRLSIIYKNINRVNFIELIITYLIFLIYSFLIFKYNFDILNTMFVGILNEYHLTDLIICYMEVFMLSLITLLSTSTIKYKE